jgi:RNase P/RNase MRP subunit p29
MKNGTLNADRTFATGAFVQVMPRMMAFACTRQQGINPGTRYNESAEQRLQTAGFVGQVTNKTGNVYRLKVAGTSVAVYIHQAMIFGLAYDLGDVVEVSSRAIIGQPPSRRIFIGYAFDARFNPVVQTYSERDTTSILSEGNTVSVAMARNESWNFCHPQENTLVPKAPVFDVSVARNGSHVRINQLTRLEWCRIYDDA